MTREEVERGHGFMWPLLSREKLEEINESRKDGISPELENAVKWSAMKVLIHASNKLHMDIVALAAACIYFHRFFATKSLAPHRNNVLVVAMACLYLAGKSEDPIAPKSVRDILYACLERRYADNPEMLRQFHSREWYEKARERIFYAERALLYEMGFSFNVDLVYPVVVALLSSTAPDDNPHKKFLAPAAQALRAYTADGVRQQALSQLCFQLANESLRTTLSLQYPAVKIGVACVWLAIKLLQLRPVEGREDEVQGWWATAGLAPHELEDISSQILDIYTPFLGDVLSGDLVLTGIDMVDTAELEAAAEADAAQQQQQQQQQEEWPHANGVAHATAGLPAAAAAAAGAMANGPPAAAAQAAAARVEAAAGVEEYDELERFLESQP